MTTNDLSTMLDFMDDEDGFKSPLMPSTKYPEGKSYAIKSPDAKTGLRLSAISDITMKQARGIEIAELDIKRLRIEDEDEREFIEQVLSPAVVAEMIDDGCRWEHVKRLGLYAFVFFGVSREAADDAVKRGLFKGKGLMPPKNRAARRSSSTKAKSTTSDSGASSKTKRKD